MLPRAGVPPADRDAAGTTDDAAPYPADAPGQAPPHAGPPSDDLPGSALAFYQNANAALLRRLQALDAEPDDPVTVTLIRRATAPLNARVQTLEQELHALRSELMEARAARAGLEPAGTGKGTRSSHAAADALQIVAALIQDAGVLHGVKEADVQAWVSRSGLLDSDFYLSRYPDVKDSPYSAIQHYVSYGVAERRCPSALFDRTTPA